MDEKKRMQVIAENITYYRKQRGITQKELAKEVGITPSTMTDYMKLRSAPSFGVIQKLADFFGIKKSDIDTTFKEEKSTIPSTTPTQAPDSLVTAINNKVVYLDQELKEPRHSAWISHGERLLDEQNTVENSTNTVDEPVVTYYTYNYYDQPASAGTGQYLNDVQVETIELPVDYDADFVVPIYGDSMEPEYHSGDYVFVKLSVNLANGDIGVFEYYGDAYIKQLLINEDGAFLHSLNSEYNDIKIDRDSDFRIIGEVVGMYREG
ncbi:MULTISPECIES: XRE family transcriptional regulator [Streptococcus]|uniref:XRE family transcriptional regulator n=1 Tax=Streptococcus caledonicus TaxID=2614158 RepID=A0ABW0UBY3_9STRE|nr:XRE family transcriptional regulator [Streptococcus sp. S784/96/1]